MQDARPAISPDPSCIGVYSTLFVLFLATLHKDSVPGKTWQASRTVVSVLPWNCSTLLSLQTPHRVYDSWVTFSNRAFPSFHGIIISLSVSFVCECPRMSANVREFLKVLCNSVLPVLTNRTRNIVSFEKVQR